MGGQIAPHELLKRILQGTALPRPLFLPIVFSHAARVENLRFPAFLTNPTKITQGLRQIHAHLQSDGLTCYFDPYLEIEALGGILEWGSGEQPSVHWTRNPVNADLPEGLHTMDELPTRGRIPVAVEVIRRLKSLVRDECLLTVGISGPFALAAQLVRAERDASDEPGVSSLALEVASEVVAPIAKAFLEVGANVVFIREELPSSASAFADLASLLATTINIVRFYEGIPVLLLNSGSQYPSPAFHQSLGCIACPVLSETPAGTLMELVKAAPSSVGIAIPVGVIVEGQPRINKFAEEFRQIVTAFQPALITTSANVPHTADLGNLRKLRNFLNA